ncbi:MAG: dephospho-CoA kinase [Tissierellia bacterium]|nr:dephospho-CoA kinase [Tissierellia bacterium]
MRSSTRLIGITGGIATGKSTVSNIIREFGYMVIDADDIAREVMEKGMPAYRQVVNSFGEEILMPDGSIDRKRLGDIIFNDPKYRKRLNNIVHPHIFMRMKELIEEYSNEGNIVFLDIPLLIETMEGIQDSGIPLDEIWLVYTDESTQLQRLMKRDCIDRSEAIGRLRSQMPIESKRKYATRIIDNRGDLDILNRQMNKLMNDII